MNFFFLSQFENYSLTEPISKINEILSSLLRISAEEFYVMYQGKPLNPKISGIDHGVSRNSAIEINFRCKGGLPKPVHTSSYTQYSKNEIRTHKLKFFDYARYLLSHDIHEGNMTLSALQKKISDPNNTGRERHIEEICSRTLDKKIIILVACNDQDTIAVALEGNIIQYYDCELTLLTAYQADAIPDDEKITCLGMSCDDNYLYIGTNQGNIYIYNAPEERFHKSISPKKDINYTQLDEIKQIYGFKSDQKYGDKSEYFAVLDSSCQVIIYNAVTLEEEKLASMKLNSIVQPKATSPLHRRYTTQANFTLGKIKEIRVNDSKTELNCITSKRVTKVTLRIIESKVVPFLVPRPPEENEFPSNLNLTPSHDFTEKELEDYYRIILFSYNFLDLILLIVSSSNETEFWIDKNKNTIIGFDRKKFHLIKPHDEILSENLSVLRGAHLYVSRYQNKIKILKATQLVEEIFNTEADKIHSKFMHSKKKGKFNFRKVKKPALCIVISPDNKYLYSGWEDGKIRVMNLQKRKEEAEILTVEILEESLLPPNNKGDSEIITNLKSPKDYQKRQNRTKIISHLDILLKDQLDYSENAQDNEFISDMEVTALSVSHNFIIGGYSNGYIVFFNHHIHNYQIFKVYKGPDSDNHPRKLRKINSMLVTKDQRTLIVSTPVMIYKLSLNQDPPEVFLERTDIYIYYNPSMKKSTSSLFNLDDSTIRTKFNPTFNQLTYVEENLLVTKVAEKDFIFIEIDNPEENVIISLDRNIPGEIVSLGITQDLDKIVIACSDGTILIYEVESKNLLNRFSLKKPRDGTLKINDMKLTEEGMLIFAMESGELRTVEISTQEEDVRIFEDLKLEHKQ